MRYSSTAMVLVAQLGIAANAERAAALCFCSTEHAFSRTVSLRAGHGYRCGIPLTCIRSGLLCNDLLLTWDHHTADDGLYGPSTASRIEDSNHLLVSLNEIGTEMEILCAAPA